jgi:hypothetical protein
MNYAPYRNPAWVLTILRSAIRRFNSSADVRLLYPKSAGPFSSAGPVGERTIAHRFAVHLETEIHALKKKNLCKIVADCEYNRHRQAMKTLDVEADLKHIVKAAERKLRRHLSWRRWYRFTFFPDIVVHERTIDDGNLLAIELKRESNRVIEERDYDDLKLRLLTRHREHGYDYVLGAGVTGIDCGPREERGLKLRVLYIRGRRLRTPK